eukprot:9613589-Alexandrium_andersonii.AAC.1
MGIRQGPSSVSPTLARSGGGGGRGVDLPWAYEGLRGTSSDPPLTGLACRWPSVFLAMEDK